MAKKRSDPKDAKGTLGTFAGVFTPSILTILGIILFLRLGYVVGNAGLGRALVIIATALLLSVYQYLKRTAGPSRWSSAARPWTRPSPR